MAQRCPFCKARLWTDPWLGPGRLECPRCGNEFRSTIPWGYFRALVVLLVILAVAIILSLPDRFLWLLILLAAVVFVIWYLPRSIDLAPVAGELNPSEGMIQEDSEWDEKLEELRESSRFRLMAVAALVAVLILLAILWWKSWFG